MRYNPITTAYDTKHNRPIINADIQGDQMDVKYILCHWDRAEYIEEDIGITRDSYVNLYILDPNPKLPDLHIPSSLHAREIAFHISQI